MSVKKLSWFAIAACFATSIGLFSAPVAASAISKVFGELTDSYSSTANKPGAYQSQVRNTFSGGSGRIRFAPQSGTTVLGLTFQQPDLNIGCNGIDWHFGSIAWVSGDAIIKLIQQTARAAPMYILKLAINALCEDCASELSQVLNAIRDATQASTNSCKLAEGLAEKLVGAGGERLKQTCQNAKAESGSSGSYSGAAPKCESPRKSWINLKDSGFLQSVKQGAKKVADNCGGDSIFDCISPGSPDPDTDGDKNVKENNTTLAEGNWAWMELQARGLVLDLEDIRNAKAGMGTGDRMMDRGRFSEKYNMGLAMGELLMSLSGTTVVTGGVTYNPAPTIPQTAAGYAAVVGTLLCGAEYFEGQVNDIDGVTLRAEAARVVKNACTEIFGAQTDEKGKEITAFEPLSVSSIDVYSCTDSATVGADPFEDARLWKAYDRCYTDTLPDSTADEDEGEDEGGAGPPSSLATSDVLRKIPLVEWMKKSHVRSTLGGGTLSLTMGYMQNIMDKVMKSNLTNQSEAFSEAEIAFIQAVPFPLYKLLNYAAIFPEIRHSIMDTYGRIIGVMLANEFINRYMMDASQFSGNPKNYLEGQDQIAISATVDKLLSGMDAHLKVSYDQLSADLERGALIQAHVRNIEQRMRDSIFARNLLGNEAFIMNISTAPEPSTAPATP